MRPCVADFECQDAPVTCLGVSTDTDTGIQVTACGAPPHPRPCCRGRVWRSFGSDLGSRVFEGPFVAIEVGALYADCEYRCTLMSKLKKSSTRRTWTCPAQGYQGVSMIRYQYYLCSRAPHNRILCTATTATLSTPHSGSR